MADETKPAPVTDSRMPGFNKEVEESQAAAEKAAAEKAAAATPVAPAPAAPPPRKNVLVRLLAGIVDHLGNRPDLVALVNDVEKALKDT